MESEVSNIIKALSSLSHHSLQVPLQSRPLLVGLDRASQHSIARRAPPPLSTQVADMKGHAGAAQLEASRLLPLLLFISSFLFCPSVYFSSGKRVFIPPLCRWTQGQNSAQSPWVSDLPNFWSLIKVCQAEFFFKKLHLKKSFKSPQCFFSPQHKRVGKAPGKIHQTMAAFDLALFFHLFFFLFFFCYSHPYSVADGIRVWKYYLCIISITCWYVPVLYDMIKSLQSARLQGFRIMNYFIRQVI